jgi:adenosylmethionine-8-amino-7-oxononanoate aminotransferase
MSRVLHRTTTFQPDVAVEGRGHYLVLADGREIFDASGGAAVACIGHGDARVADAIGRQAGKMSYAHTGFFTSEPAEALADLLLADEPGGLCRAFFVSSGSEAMESAIKISRQYFLEQGQAQRTHVIARRQGYHGNTFAALAASGNLARRKPYEAILPSSFSLVSPCFPYRGQLTGESDAAYVDRLGAELEAEFQRIGADKVMAFCAEPVVGATAGCVAPVPGYFRRIREICDRHGALLVLDEIMCGMGRTGTTHAWEQEGVTPDIQTIGKGLGGGYQAIAAMLISNRVLEALNQGSGAFVHGHTYQAHPVACAAALEVQKIIQERDLLANVQTMGAALGQALQERLGQHSHVGDIRGRGLFHAVELVADRDSKTPFEPDLQIHERVKRAALDLGLGIYPTAGTADGWRGEHILIAPPYTVDADDIDLIADRLHQAINTATRASRRQSPRHA